MNNKKQIDLINRICEWVFNSTESWEFRNIGSDLAYLVWAIAANSIWLGPENPKDKELVRVIKTNPNGLWETLLKKGLVQYVNK